MTTTTHTTACVDCNSLVEYTGDSDQFYAYYNDGHVLHDCKERATKLPLIKSASVEEQEESSFIKLHKMQFGDSHN
jgi:hypothetical protein